MSSSFDPKDTFEDKPGAEDVSNAASGHKANLSNPSSSLIVRSIARSRYRY